MRGAGTDWAGIAERAMILQFYSLRWQSAGLMPLTPVTKNIVIILLTQAAKKFPNVFYPNFGHLHDGVVTALLVFRPAHDRVRRFAELANRNVCFVEDDHRSRHA